MPYTKIKLKIADTIIAFRSKFPHQKFSGSEKAEVPERFRYFFYSGNRRGNIRIDVRIANILPKPPRGTRPLFITYHYIDGNENWRLLKKGDRYIYTTPFKDKAQAVFINRAFDRATAYLLPKANGDFVWHVSELIYDFLQVLLINYFAQRESGIFVHGVGIKDLDKRGYVFAGKSGAGKSTTARIWHRYSRAMILNDDRVIVRRHKKKFLVYGSPWHGDFSDYLSSRMESAHIRRFFFIRHSVKNEVKPVPPEKVFRLLYPAIFPAFWDRGYLRKTISFCQDLIRDTPCFDLGFVKNKKIIEFVRNLD